MSISHILAWPESGSIMPVSIFTVVLFPAPFGPRKPRISPGRTSRSSRSTARTSPKDLLSPPASIFPSNSSLPVPEDTAIPLLLVSRR